MIALLIGMTRRHVIELRRYAFDSLVQIIGFSALFLLLFWGAKGIGGDDIIEGDTLPSIVAGYMVFALTMFSFFQIVQWVANESMLGTLEQLALSPFGLYRVFLAEFLSSLGTQIVLMGGLTLMVMSATGEWLSFDLLTLLPLIALVLCGVLGFSFALAGAALVFKRVQSLMNLVQGVLLALVAVPIAEVPVLRFAPISLPNSLIRDSTVRGVSLFDMPTGDLVVATLVAVAYFAAGSVVFIRFERQARERDLIGAY